MVEIGGIVVGRGSVAINDHYMEQWSRLPPNTRNLGRDSRPTPKGHGSLEDRGHQYFDGVR